MCISKFEKIVYFFCIILFSCSTSSVTSKISNAENKKLEIVDLTNDSTEGIKQTTFDNFNKKLDSLILYIEKQNQLINESISDLSKQVILFDSLHSKNIINITLLEDKINIISKSYNEIAQLNTIEKIEEIPPLTKKEFQEMYIEALGAYQNGNMKKSLDSFKYLLKLKTNYDLLDNCQYWIGEIYFKMKEYHNAIIELEKVFDYVNSNKHDDALYKLSKCYLSLNNEKQADYELNKLVNNYPNSEYVKKAKLILNN